MGEIRLHFLFFHLMDNMSIGAWNIRGLNTTLKTKEVLHFIHSSHLQLVGILETRVRVSNLTSTLLVFSHAWSFDHNALFAHNMRILVLRNPETVAVSTVFRSD